MLRHIGHRSASLRQSVGDDAEGGQPGLIVDSQVATEKRFSRSRTVERQLARRPRLRLTASPDRQRRHTSSTSAGDNGVRTTRTTPSLAEAKIMSVAMTR
jgi:hypothetical protein